MRILIALLGASGLFAQSAGPSPSIDQAKVLRDKLEHKSPHVLSLSPSTAPSFTAFLAPDGRVLDVIEDERCAIPLVEMQKKADPAPMPKLKGLAAAPMPQVKVPAPSCKQMAQAAPGLVQTGPNAYETAP